MEGLEIVAVVFVIAVLLILIFVFLSRKMRANFFQRHLEMSKDLLKDNKKSLKELAGSAAELQKEILTENEDVLKEVSAKSAEIESVGIEKKAAAFKKGFTADKDTKFCKHCGAIIEADSIFCKECGKKQ